jgi:hypothetical protein
MTDSREAMAHRRCWPGAPVPVPVTGCWLLAADGPVATAQGFTDGPCRD